MTTLDHPTSTASDLPSAGLPSPGLAAGGVSAADRLSVSSSAPVAATLSAPAAALCSIAAAVDSGAAGGTRGDSVPRPRAGDGGEGSAGAGTAGFIRLQPPVTAAAADQAVPVLRAVPEESRTVLARRPSPSRRLRRMHPEAAPAGETETAEQRGAMATAVPPAVAGGEPDPAVPVGAAAPVSGAAPAGGAVAAAAETPLGILIGGSPNLPEAAGRTEERQPVRVTAELVRIGRGTVLVVLPAWRPAIAVSVPTEHLLQAAGLALEQLAGAQLSVLINPGALHDRELDLRGWQSGPAGRPGRRGGRPPL